MCVPVCVCEKKYDDGQEACMNDQYLTIPNHLSPQNKSNDESAFCYNDPMTSKEVDDGWESCWNVPYVENHTICQ